MKLNYITLFHSICLEVKTNFPTRCTTSYKSFRTYNRAHRRISLTGTCRLLTFAAVAQSLGGCSKDDPHHTPHPDKGAVVVSTDWSGRSSDAVPPDTYVLRIGPYEQMVSGETNVLSTLFNPEKHDLLVWHTAEGITVDGATATVNTLPDGTLHPKPGHLFSAARELEIIKDDTLRITVPMKQHIRRLTLILKLSPEDKPRIGSTTATLTGIASTTNIVTGQIVDGEGGTIVPAFTPATDADTPENRAGTQPVLSTTLHLLGTAAGERQLLTMKIRLTNGDLQTVSTDLTEMLKDFRNGDMEHLVLNATLELPAEAEAGASITDWNVVDNGAIGVN